MKKVAYAEHVFLTDGEFLHLIEKFGESTLKIRIRRLTELKKTGKRNKDLKSDFRSLLTEGMQEVEPIRDKRQIEEMKNVLRRDSERNWFLFSMGINVGLRISDLLSLQVKDVRNQTHIRLRE